MYLANDLVARGYEVSMMSPIMSPDVERCLQIRGIKPLNLHVKHVTRNSSLSLLWFETWMHEAFFKLNSRRVSDDFCIAINFSQVILTPSLFWYLQGPLSVALRDMGKELATTYRVVYNILRPVIEYVDERLVKEMGKGSAFVVANSEFCASMYSKFGVKVQDIIYPPIDCEIFRPSTSILFFSYG
jgi:glycosyltransferase involved in cell wall biosynthesis